MPTMPHLLLLEPPTVWTLAAPGVLEISSAGASTGAEEGEPVARVGIHHMVLNETWAVDILFFWLSHPSEKWLTE